MTTIDLLQRIGLNKYEAEAYYTLLQHGALTGYEVGKYSHVPLSRSYEILERLLEKGLVLVQPGEPPRYSAQDPRLVLGSFRSTMEEALTALGASLSTLARVDTTHEFWVLRGRNNLLAQLETLISDAQTTLSLTLPDCLDLADVLAQARDRGCHVTQLAAETSESNTILLLQDDHQVFIGTLTPADTCQALISSNAALLATLRGYFLARQTPYLLEEVQPLVASPTHDVTWLDWEIRKQRHLQRKSARVI